MSTAPNGWQAPKTLWQSADVPGAADFSRIESNANATELGTRTLEPALAPTSNIGTLRQILSWLPNRIRAIMGTTNWYDAPPVTLQGAKGHIDAASPHSGHATTTELSSHTSNKSNPHAVTAAQVGAATKGYVDDLQVVSAYGGTSSIFSSSSTAWVPVTNAKVSIDIPVGVNRVFLLLTVWMSATGARGEVALDNGPFAYQEAVSVAPDEASYRILQVWRTDLPVGTNTFQVYCRTTADGGEVTVTSVRLSVFCFPQP